MEAALTPDVSRSFLPALFDGEREFALWSARSRTAARAASSPLRLYQATPEIASERTTAQQVFEAIQSLYLSRNEPRDRQIAQRLITLHRDAIAEDETILADSLSQFTAFFLLRSDLSLPKITLTPDGTIRARWIHGPRNFAAIEFTGRPLVKLIAEIPRGNGQTAQHFSYDYIANVVSLAHSVGAPLA